MSRSRTPGSSGGGGLAPLPTTPTIRPSSKQQAAEAATSSRHPLLPHIAQRNVTPAALADEEKEYGLSEPAHNLNSRPSPQAQKQPVPNGSPNRQPQPQPASATTPPTLAKQPSAQREAAVADGQDSLSDYQAPAPGPAAVDYDIAAITNMSDQEVLTELKQANFRAEQYRKAHEVLRKHLTSSLQPHRIAQLTNRIVELEGHLRNVLLENKTLTMGQKRLERPGVEVKALKDLAEQLTAQIEQSQAYKEKIRTLESQEHDKDSALRKAMNQISSLESMCKRLTHRVQTDADKIKKLELAAKATGGEGAVRGKWQIKGATAPIESSAASDPSASPTSPTPGQQKINFTPIQSSSFMDRGTLLATKKLNDEILVKEKERVRLYNENRSQKKQITELRGIMDVLQKKCLALERGESETGAAANGHQPRSKSETRVRRRRRRPEQTSTATAAAPPSRSPSRSPDRYSHPMGGSMRKSASEKHIVREDREAQQTAMISAAAARRLKIAEDRARARQLELNPPPRARVNFSPQRRAQLLESASAPSVATLLSPSQVIMAAASADLPVSPAKSSKQRDGSVPRKSTSPTRKPKKTASSGTGDEPAATPAQAPAEPVAPSNNDAPAVAAPPSSSDSVAPTFLTSDPPAESPAAADSGDFHEFDDESAVNAADAENNSSSTKAEPSTRNRFFKRQVSAVQSPPPALPPVADAAENLPPTARSPATAEADQQATATTKDSASSA